MSRMKRHKIKTEKPVASTSYSREQEHDLAYYIHDRVELIHQVFSILTHKEIKAMAPECVRHISVGDLQELCTEELLGISSKRLLAVLDGTSPPSDTESSSRSASPPLETISLDSISSDDEILSQSSKKKKHKHRRRNSKSKSKKKKSQPPQDSEDAEKSKASRAGLTVLELLELQARARAIRAQLQQEQVKVPTTTPTTDKGQSPSDNEVEIKEEPPDVVEISSEDEKPDIKELEKQTESLQARQVVRQPSPEADGKTVTKRINDLIITVPQAAPSKKIKLNRNKPRPPVIAVEKPIVAPKPVVVDPKTKSKKKKKDKKKKPDKEGSDHDEITLQLSDSEKMDLLGSLEQKNSEAVSTEDSESSSDSEEERVKKDKLNEKKNKNKRIVSACDKNTEVDTRKATAEKDGDSSKPVVQNNVLPVAIDENVIDNVEVRISEQNRNTQKAAEIVSVDNTIRNDKQVDQQAIKVSNTDEEKITHDENTTEALDMQVKDIPLVRDSQELSDDLTKDRADCASQKGFMPATSSKTAEERELSEGEVSDRDSSEVEAFEPLPEVVFVSDDETHKKKKKKKDKKAKKEKKCKKDKSDFHEGADQNFYKKDNGETIDDGEVIRDSDPIILDLSDDSSCYEVEGAVLSKEPTAEEIEALSARIDEIEREEVVTDEQIREHERMLQEREESTEIESVCWKDRYLDSRKVKKVLSTSNILNAMRKKNKELKKKLEESKMKEDRVILENVDDVVVENLEEGTIDHYNTLQGSTKFVDSVKEPVAENRNVKNSGEDAQKVGETEDGKVTKEIKKDAKQLLKMYKKLLKYNDMNKQRDPNKKKKKKKKSKSQDGEEAT